MLSVVTLLAVAVTDLLRLVEPRLPRRRAGVFLQAAWWLILTVVGLLWFAPVWWAGLAVKGHKFLPVGGQDFGPLVAVRTAHWWPAGVPAWAGVVLATTGS